MPTPDNALTVLRVTSGGAMLIPDDIQIMLDLHRAGIGTKRIAEELGVSRNTVRRYLRQGGWQPYGKPSRARSLDGLHEWIREAFFRHHGNAEVIRQELVSKHNLKVSLRTVERQVQAMRKELKARAVATVRFETPPGRQLQIDFGSKMVDIAGKKVKAFLFVATLGYSRRTYVALFSHERQSAWLEGLEGAFRYFGGVPDQVLMDNARALVKHHNPETREVTFNERLLTFAQYWGFQPKACAPYRARTKGKDERAVGYVKNNAIAGRTFASWEALRGHLVWWMREVADVRVHGTCGERPIDRYSREEAEALKPLEGRPSFGQVRELQRTVHSDGCVEVDRNFYSVPWKYIGEAVTIQITDGELLVFCRELEIARHTQSKGHRERSVARGHLEGVVSSRCTIEKLPFTGFDRPLAVYQELVGGTW